MFDNFHQSFVHSACYTRRNIFRVPLQYLACMKYVHPNDRRSTVCVVHDSVKPSTFIQNVYFFLEPYKVFVVVYKGTFTPSQCILREVPKYWRNTLGPAYNEFGYYEHPPTRSRFLCIKIIDSNVKKFGYYEHPPTTSSFLCIYLLIISGT